MTINTEHWRNDTDRENPKYSVRNLSHYHFVHKSHKHLSGKEPVPVR